MDNGDVIVREIVIDAPQKTVYEYLTNAEKLLEWKGTVAEIEAVPGGKFYVGFNEMQEQGEFKELIPYSRVVFTWGWVGNPDVPPGSSTVEIDLVVQGDSTLLRLTHSGLPNEESRKSHEDGWIHYLGRLQIRASGGDPGPDDLLIKGEK